MWSVDCFCFGVVGGIDEEAGGEAVGAYFVGAVVAGRITIMHVAQLVGQRAQGVDIVHPVLDGDGFSGGYPSCFWPAAVPADAVSAGFCGLYEGF